MDTEPIDLYGKRQIETYI
ncbi:hypothetical protein Gotri_002206 [Gossypium trilobum]|uniref:Uncharacterized protein n=1 Tax=Gossypium trilobum TaxID=34281 RepID=A0A7J9F7J6_9ROSI|nr:hypothetical protein [Gossypium trilobum]